MAADNFSWNNSRSLEREVILRFLNEAQVRINAQPGAIPLNSGAASRTVEWLRSILDRKPSEIVSRD